MDDAKEVATNHTLPLSRAMEEFRQRILSLPVEYRQTMVREFVALQLEIDRHVSEQVDVIARNGQEELWASVNRLNQLHATEMEQQRLGFEREKREAVREPREQATDLDQRLARALEMNDQLLLRVDRDSKTKLFTHEFFVEKLKQRLMQPSVGRWLCVGFMDCASFKFYNDAISYDVGDKILIRIADILKRSLRMPDFPARFGGDENEFFISELAEYETAYDIAQRFKERVEAYDWAGLEDARLQIKPPQVDIGIVCLRIDQPIEKEEVALKATLTLISEAERLMKKAKDERSHHVFPLRARFSDDGELVPIK